jgi:photosystem II stability/assembly factor-like uncharacterized protein
MKRWAAVILVLSMTASNAALGARKKGEEAEKKAPESPLNAELLSGLTLREIGPAIASGRISDIAVDPDRTSTWYVAVASGGVWKTVNAGNTWQSIFDDQTSYSIGCVTLDPNDSRVVWVGTGENNSQRSVSYGDGVYKSIDGGKTWAHMGLRESEHIGRIVVDPRDSDVVYVAAQGPLWRAGGDRGLYKTMDGGKTWQKVLEIDEHTGVNEVWMDPRDPDVLLASTYQRRRHTWTLINGGPGSGIHRSTDGGATWTKITSGLPSEEMGKIGLAISPTDPDVAYAIIESIDDAGGVFRSTDGGLNWEKRGDYVSGSPQYYNELIPDPHDVDRVYSNDTWLHVTEDGGATWTQVPERAKHVDNHALWINPDDVDHLIAGCDGGVYESWDRGENWDFKANLPITQFYKIAVDDELPFYNVYGGTQDNSTLGGPSRTRSDHGITNRDWFVTVGGDGFDPGVEPGNPDVVYSQWQNGGLVRYDRRTGDLIDIRPQPEPGEDPARWNWDAAFLISPHSPTRIYYAAQRLYRSEDRGNSWQRISPDLTRNSNRNELPVMGRLWSVDSVAKNRSTSYFGNVVSLTESPLVSGLVYVGTDDGLVQVTEDGGGAWRRVDAFPGVPDMAYVADLEASLHDPDTVYAAIDNHKKGDFKPYLLVSEDRGRTWRSIAGDLPERGNLLTVAQDHEKADLLFAGTEFGVFASLDAGKRWIPLSGGDFPPISVHDLEIQRRESDLVVGTFGRGIWILDDYSPLRSIDESTVDSEALLFAPRRAWSFMESLELGYPDKGFQGDAFYNAPNPPTGAVFTYYLKDGLVSLEEARRKAEKQKIEKGEDVHYPTWEELRSEDRAQDPAIVLTVRDADGEVVRRITGPVGEGIHRVDWDLRYPPADPARLTPPEFNPFALPPMGPTTVPGTYSVNLAKWENEALTELAPPQTFETAAIGQATLPDVDREATLAFQQRTARLQRAAMGASRVVRETQERIAHLRVAAHDTPADDASWRVRLEEIETALDEVGIELQGDRTIAARAEPTPPSILDRISDVVGGHWTSTSAPTATHRRSYEIAAEAFAPVLESLRSLESDLSALEAEMEAAGAPWTPGRVPTWQPE